MVSDESASGPPSGIVFDGRRFRVRVETLPQAVGGTARFEIVETPAAAAVVPVLAASAGGEPLVVLVEQERPAVGRRTLEIPAGLVNAHPDGTNIPESPEQAARRELEEETGYSAPAESLRLLTQILTSPGITNEVIHIYLANDISPQRARSGPEDPSEIARVHTMPLAKAVDAIAHGEIQDAKTIAGLLLARDTLRGRLYGGQSPANGGATMPTDPTNMPQGALDNAPVSGESGGAKPSSLTAENILTQEFGYANITAYQAQEDRARFFGLYLTLVGILAAALGAVAQLSSFDRQLLLPIGAGLLLLAGGLGVIFFRLLIRLREAWFGSALAMNTIKEYYIERLNAENPSLNLERAFLWRLTSLPRADKPRTPTYMVSYTTATISSLCTAGGVAILGFWLASASWTQNAIKSAGIGIDQNWISAGLYVACLLIAAAVFGISIRRLTAFYKTELDPDKRNRAIAQQEQTLQGK